MDVCDNCTHYVEKDLRLFGLGIVINKVKGCEFMDNEIYPRFFTISECKKMEEKMGEQNA